jgi:GNAT superfamily N-acetyltransferase
VSLPADLHERAVGPDDGPALAALTRACDETYLEWAPAGWAPPEVPSDWAATFPNPERWAHVAVEPAGRVVGLVAFRPAHADKGPGPPTGPPLPGVAHVVVVQVHPSRWREGIAAALLAGAEAAMVARGYVRERLWTPEGAPAERFYTAQGWTRDGRRAWHPWVGLTVVGYSRVL